MAVYTSETCHLKLDIKTINMSLFLRGGVFRCKTSTSAKNTWPAKESSHLLELSTQSATTIHNKMCTVNKMGMYVPLGGNRLYEIDLRVKKLKKGDGVGRGVDHVG
ncbi:hypothetical protein MTR_3g466430 [Medicago truncatula]|uniref:Uncharacterized protein n=1 Tax=Medicago truncatula TaxID=3880 RepID=A0A072UZA1_MEDTR|nr:hypothetical protein MTR_3g466430 [Medicago truncatula]